jgi:Domain of unknown function (DUF4115)
VFLPSDSAYDPPAKAPVAQTSPAPTAPAPVAAQPSSVMPTASRAVTSAPILPTSPAPRPLASAPILPTPTAASATAAVAPGASAARPGVGPTALRVRIQGLEDTWVRYTVDRRSAMEVLMHPAESTTLDADDEVHLTLGKSTGVSVYLNGEEVLLPNERNRLVADLVLNKTTLQKLRN